MNNKSSVINTYSGKLYIVLIFQLNILLKSKGKNLEILEKYFANIFQKYEQYIQLHKPCTFVNGL